MRRLSLEERALWGHVARSVKPIRGRTAVPVQAPSVHLAETSGKASTRNVPGQGQRASPPSLAIKAPAAPSANTLDGSWDKRLRLGQASPDFTIDLHGETLASAHTRLNHSLAIAVRHGARIVLLITGRPARDNPRLPPTSRGVIRASVMDWLAASSFAAQIAAIRGAHPRHGGAGALYLIMKRAR